MFAEFYMIREWCFSGTDLNFSLWYLSLVQIMSCRLIGPVSFVYLHHGRILHLTEYHYVAFHIIITTHKYWDVTNQRESNSFLRSFFQANSNKSPIACISVHFLWEYIDDQTKGPFYMVNRFHCHDVWRLHDINSLVLASFHTDQCLPSSCDMIILCMRKNMIYCNVCRGPSKSRPEISTYRSGCSVNPALEYK